jgi:hypothetical protein
VALSVSDNAPSDIVTGCVIERPKVIRNPRTGIFVMRFQRGLKGRSFSGGSNAETPKHPILARDSAWMSRVMALLVDDDGAAGSGRSNARSPRP